MWIEADISHISLHFVHAVTLRPTIGEVRADLRFFLFFCDPTDPSAARCVYDRIGDQRRSS
jgi:hypothetical protein